jgi:glycosyltransferase involved in cell wall biosynthesis
MLKVVISGVNLVEGGILSILQDSLKAMQKVKKLYDLEITVLIHDKNLIDKLDDETGFKFVEFPGIKSSWLKRVYFEYFQCRNISNKIRPHLWLSLHDMTPNVNCNFQVVYCHNGSAFYGLEKRYFFYDLKFSMFCLFYKYLYRINIKKNAYVIIQQNWIREEFWRLFKVKTIVAHPVQNVLSVRPVVDNVDHLNIDFGKVTFFFPSIPRTFKNFEVLCEAGRILGNQVQNFEIILTLNGTENKYARYVFEKYKDVKGLRFIGLQKRDIIQALYNKVNFLVFPSKLETWGLPISEFKVFGKPILVSDLPYAHENIGDYDKVKFFDPLNADQLATYMLMFIENKMIFDSPKSVTPASPFFDNWDNLLHFLIGQVNERNKPNGMDSIKYEGTNK